MLRYRITLGVLVVMLFSLVLAPSLTAQEIIGTTSGDLNVRTGPDASHGIVSTLPVQAQVVVEGRTQIGDWLLIHTPDGGIRGWVASRFVYLPEGVPVQSLGVVDPVVLAAPAAAAAPPAEAPTGNAGAQENPLAVDPGSYGTVPLPASVQGDLGAIIARLESTPILYNFGGGGVYSIYAQGQAQGNRSHVFTRVGDSITANQPFMIGFGNGDYNLGGYGYLQDTINFFNESPRGAYRNSFEYDSMAARSAFNAGAVLDRLWTDLSLCTAEEAPLQCEYRILKPFVAIIMVGSVDMQIYDVQRYNEFVDHIVRISRDSGVIPVLTTFPIPPDYIYYEASLRFNMVLLDIADRYGIPVINLWQAARMLPDNGVGPDRYHLSQGPTFFSLTGEEATYGVTLRNLLTLQALDELRRGVLR